MVTLVFLKDHSGCGVAVWLGMGGGGGSENGSWGPN